MMIRNFIIPSMCLLGIVVSVSAQYVQNHQQLFIDAMKNEKTSIFAEALEPVEIDKQAWLWTGNWNPSTFDSIPTRPLLVKMQSNTPLSNPFSIEWAMTYLFPGEENNQASPYALYVRDVHHVPNTKEYILCGQYMDTEKLHIFGGFLLKTDSDGSPILFRYYPSLEVLNSVVSKRDSDTGYIAVGSTKNTQENPYAAAFLSVDYDLTPVCLKQMHGSFRVKGFINSHFKKVIAYGKNEFATVGTTSNFPQDKHLSSSNVLVSIFDEKCNTKCNNNFGGLTFKKTLNNGKAKYNQFFETGESLAEVGSGGEGLVVTGKTRRTQTAKKSRVLFDDILLFRTNADCSLKFIKKFDVDKNTDIGLAVQIRNVGDLETIVVAGQSRNRYVSTDSKYSNDVALLVTKLDNGAFLNLELFGDNGDEGALRGDVGIHHLSRGNVDLHLSHNSAEQYPIVLANTMNSWPEGQNNPYLIERYDSIKKECHDYKRKAKVGKYRFLTYVATEMWTETDVGKEDLKGQEVKLSQTVLCEKVE